MRGKKFTHGITFFVTAEMYKAIKSDTDELRISSSDLMRRLIEDYLYGTHFYSRPSFEEREIEETSKEEAEPNE
jgi:negative regulator of replication initiation